MQLDYDKVKDEVELISDGTGISMEVHKGKVEKGRKEKVPQNSSSR
ncbi:hypothetical protein V6M85_03270 [Sulfolobus tengchongensis]|uniref:Uncharacterized protein n=1 Tax=Sulfolobus tengchongensis TaxID=207809 RepID=A0AAX4L1U5_9CREN